MLTLFPSGLGPLGSWHIPEGCTGLVPKDWLLWADGAGEDVPANEPCPMDLACLFPSAQAHNLQIQGVLLQWNYIYYSHKMWSVWALRALKSPKGSMSPGVGVPTPGSFFRVTPLMGESNLQRMVLQELGCVQGVGVRKDEGRQHKPCVFLLAHSV